MTLIRKNEYFVEEQEDEKGRLLKRSWFDARQRKAHRVGGPAIETFDPESGIVIGEVWVNYREGGIHREDDLPAVIKVDPNSGVTTFEEHYWRGRLHRDGDKPAGIHKDKDTGRVTFQLYSSGGQRDREGGLPAAIELNPESGNVTREEYYRDGVLHRDNGPAIVEYNEAGQAIPGMLQYYHYGREVRSPTAPRLDMP